MSVRRLVVWVMFVGCVALVAGLSIADTAKKADAAAAKMTAEMEAWMKYATPGDAHKRLEPLVGHFDAKVKFWMDPKGAPEESTGTSDTQWILGGRFIHDNYMGSAMGQPFQGAGLTGYDNYKKEYTAVWADTMGTMIASYHGQFDAAGKALTMKGQYTDPATGKMKNTRGVTRIVDANTHTYEAYEPGPDGKEMKVIEITYTRK